MLKKERKKNKLFNWASFEMEWNSWAVCTIQSEDGISFPFLSLLAVGIDGNGSLKNNDNNISTHTRKKERKKKRKRKHHQKWKKGEAEEECPFLLVTPNWYGHKWSGDGQTGERTGTLTIWRFSLLRCSSAESSRDLDTHPPTQAVTFFFLIPIYSTPLTCYRFSLFCLF